MTHDLNKLAQEALTSTIVNEILLNELASQLQKKGLYFIAEAIYNKIFYHNPLNDQNLAAYLSFLTSTNQIRKALDLLIHAITDIGSSVDRENWLTHLINSLPNNEDWQKRVKRFNTMKEVEFKILIDLEGYCAEKNIEFIKVYESKTINLPAPIANKPIYQNTFSGSCKQPSVNYAIINNLVCSSLTFTSQDSKYAIREEFTSLCRDDFVLNNSAECSVLYVPELRSYSDKGIIRKLAPTRRINGLCLSLLSPTTGNFYHFLYEQFTKVLMLQELELSQPVTILLPNNVPAQFKEIFSYYSINNTIEYIEQEDIIEIEKGIMICGLGNVVCDLSPFKNPLISDNSISQYAIELLTKNKKIESIKKSPKKVYILRPLGSGGRVDLNEADVAALAKDLGFSIVSPENLSFSEQVSIFQNCDIVLGFAGAAFANIIYCKPNTKVVIISPYEGNMMDYTDWTKPASFLSLNLSFFCTNNVGADTVYKGFCAKSVNINELQTFIEDKYK